jgi:hypothetical protein
MAKANTAISVDKREANTTEPDIAAFMDNTDERLPVGVKPHKRKLISAVLQKKSYPELLTVLDHVHSLA